MDHTRFTRENGIAVFVEADRAAALFFDSQLRGKAQADWPKGLDKKVRAHCGGEGFSEHGTV